MKQLFLLLLLACSLLAQGTDVEFVVYFAEGRIAKGANNKSLTLKKGDYLYSRDILQLDEGAQVVLICKNYNTVKLGSKGRYSIKALAAQCSKTGTSFTGTYFHYIWDELTHIHGTPEKDPKRYMRNKGAVSRGCGDVVTRLAVDTVHYYSGVLPISWSSSIHSPFLRVYNDQFDGTLLWKEQLDSGSLRLDRAAAELKEEGDYYWQITNSQGRGCERNYLRIWKEEEYKTTVDKILQDVLTTEPAETAYMKGYLLEEHHFLAEAYKYYQLAARLNPQHTIYKKAVSRFL